MTARCRFCRRLLRSPESRVLGFGPKCARDRGIPAPGRAAPVTVATRPAQRPARPERTRGPSGTRQAATRAYKTTGQLPLPACWNPAVVCRADDRGGCPCYANPPAQLRLGWATRLHGRHVTTIALAGGLL